MLCALFVVKGGHRPEQPLYDQFMASDLGEEMDTETEISGDFLLPREGSVNAYGFHLGEMKANRTKMIARHVVKLVGNSSGVFCVYFSNYLYFVIQTRATDQLS